MLCHCVPYSFCPQSSSFAEGKDSLGEIESLFLQFSFDDTHSNTGAAIDRESVYSENPQFTVIQALKNQLEHSLLSVAEQLFNCYSPDVSIPVYYTLLNMIVKSSTASVVSSYKFDSFSVVYFMQDSALPHFRVQTLSMCVCCAVFPCSVEFWLLMCVSGSSQKNRPVTRPSS